MSICEAHPDARRISVDACRSCLIQGEAAQHTLGELVRALEAPPWFNVTPKDVLEMISKFHVQSLEDALRRYPVPSK